MADYVYVKSEVSVDLLKEEILAASLTDLEGATFNEPNNLIIHTLNDYSVADKTTLDNVVTAHEGQLYNNKSEKNKQIDRKTQRLILSGFTYASKTFSLSPSAQINWIGLKQSADSGFLTYPVPVTTLGDQEHELLNAADVTAFYATGLSVIQGHLNSGRDLKVQVNAASNQTELDAVVDNR